MRPNYDNTFEMSCRRCTGPDGCSSGSIPKSGDWNNAGGWVPCPRCSGFGLEESDGGETKKLEKITGQFKVYKGVEDGR
jgi:hypothetical protein